jgi:hypothetical protein
MIVRLAAIILVCSTTVSLAQAQLGNTPQWLEYRNERYGLYLRYPPGIFQPERTSEAGDGEVLVSRDGSARLLVGALVNSDRQSVAAYQERIARDSYADYRVTYRKISGNWLALSGEGNGKAFYEKVIFTCNGWLINSFAMIYPTDQSEVFDRVVEGIEKSFRAGTSSCPDVGEAPAAPPARATARGPYATLADRIARSRGRDVIVVLRRREPPHDVMRVRGYAAR